MAAEFDKTSFGIQRRLQAATELAATRRTIVDRTTFVTNPDKLAALHRLIAAIDDVLSTLSH